MRTRRGFTLIELTVIVVITTILTSIGMAAYNNFLKRQAVDQAAKELISNLKKAQNYAVIGKKNYGSGSCTAQLYGWVADLSNKTYYGRCCNNPPRCDSLSDFPSSGQPSLISADFTISPSLTTILFKPLSGEPDITDSLEISVSKDGVLKKILLTPAGAISRKIDD
jgi:Tfp pilus assembly protein FimT